MDSGPALLLSPGALPTLTARQLLQRVRWQMASARMNRRPLSAARAAELVAAMSRHLREAIADRVARGARLRRLRGATGPPGLADVRCTLDLVAETELLAFCARARNERENATRVEAAARLLAFCRGVRGAAPARLEPRAAPLRRVFLGTSGAVFFCVRGDEAAARDSAEALIGRFPGARVACIAAKDEETFWRETRRWRAEHEGFVELDGNDGAA